MPDKEQRRPTGGGAAQVSPARSTKVRLSRLLDLAAECRGCGAVAELVQDSDYCWTCTYVEPICLCAGAGWRTPDSTDPGGTDGHCA